MKADEVMTPGSNEAFAIEVRGFDHIPESERNMTLRDVDYLWAGTNSALFSFVLGTIAITLGLNLWMALGACFLGNLTYTYLALGSIVAVRAGMPVITLTRAAFGIRGNLFNALFAWAFSVAFEVVNTIFGVYALIALFDLLGWRESGAAGKLVAVIAQLALCGSIAVLGHATMVWFQRIFAMLVGAALMLVIRFAVVKVDWAHAATPHAPLASGTSIAVFMSAAAIIASNPLSYLFNGADWVRYLPSTTPSRSIFWHVFWSSGLPALILSMLGATCATLGDMSDPVGGMRPFIPPWLFVVYIFAVIGGSLANNIPTYYSSGLSLQAIGLKLRRYSATMLDIAVSTAISLYILLVKDFSAVLTDFLAMLVVWVGPYGGVWLCDAWMRRGAFDPVDIHSSGNAVGRYWGWRGLNLRGCIALAVGMTVAFLTMKSPLLDGPLVAALGGADLSWVLGLPVSALCYRILAFRMNPRALSAGTHPVGRHES